MLRILFGHSIEQVTACSTGLKLGKYLRKKSETNAALCPRNSFRTMSKASDQFLGACIEALPADQGFASDVIHEELANAEAVTPAKATAASRRPDRRYEPKEVS